MKKERRFAARLGISLGVCLAVACAGSHDGRSKTEAALDYRAEMRSFVMEISAYCKARADGFCVVPQNGQELATDLGSARGVAQEDYLRAIDGCGRESLLYGYPDEDRATPADETARMKELCDLFADRGKQVMVIDYCSGVARIDDSYARNRDFGYISFAADQRRLFDLPAYPPRPFRGNVDDINRIGDARNFLCLINSEKFRDKRDFAKAVAATDYDLLIMDLFHNGEAYSKSEVAACKKKQDGSKRLVLCYMSIGEAEDYRYYWNPDWKTRKPRWLERENPDWKGNYKVRYWDPEWKSLIYGGADAYVDKIVEAGFDGVYLDVVDAFEYFESGR